MPYQRDLFDTQVDLMDQLHEQKAPLWAGKSLDDILARERRMEQLRRRLTAIRRVVFEAQDRGRGAQHERIVAAIQGQLQELQAIKEKARKQ